MFNNNLINLTEDPTLPNLLPEDPLPSDLFQIDDMIAPITHPDIVALNQKLDNLSLETSTQGLRVAVERAKRQRLQTTVRQVRQNLSTICPDVAKIRNDMEVMQDHQNTINFQLDGETARTSTLAFRSLSRIYQLLAVIVPCMILPSKDNHEVVVLMQELNRTIQQFGVYYTASYV